jgi:steroid delta-isomerase-like uncharacterized protein
MSVTVSAEELVDRLCLVEEHIHRENVRDLAGIMRTFGADAQLTLNGEHHPGHDRVRGLYQMLLDSFPDLHVEVRKVYPAEDAVVTEVVLHGTQAQSFLGIPATGRRVQLPMCALFQFGADGRLAGESVYFDGALLLRQVGLLPRAA